MDEDREKGTMSPATRSSPFNMLLVILVAVSLVVNIATLGTIAYLTSYTVDKVGGFEDKLETAFLFGDPDTSWADVINKQLRTDYRSLFDQASRGLNRISSGLEGSSNEH
eukprot:7888853-Pyramimonas_sp.AAC.1